MFVKSVKSSNAREFSVACAFVSVAACISSGVERRSVASAAVSNDSSTMFSGLPSRYLNCVCFRFRSFKYAAVILLPVRGSEIVGGELLTESAHIAQSNILG